MEQDVSKGFSSGAVPSGASSQVWVLGELVHFIILGTLALALAMFSHDDLPPHDGGGNLQGRDTPNTGYTLM